MPWAGLPWGGDLPLAGASPPTPRLPGEHEAELSRLVEQEIIPRLMLLHRAQDSLQPTAPVSPITVQQVHDLADLAVDGCAEAADDFVMALIATGFTQEQILLDLLAPCARWMGERWDEDTYNFSQVTVGLWRLQRVLHALSQMPAAPVPSAANRRRLLLSALPGSQHTFGVSMVAEFFGRAGWDVACEPGAGWAQLKSLLAAAHFDVFGLSISASDSIAQVASVILDIRRASANPGLFVLVGGPMAGLIPDLDRRCGADAMAADAPAAVAAADASLRRGFGAD